MAEEITDFEFKKRGAESLYPFDLWLNGKIWRLTKEGDFPKSSRENMSANLRKQARKRNGRCRVQPEGATDLVIQFFVP